MCYLYDFTKVFPVDDCIMLRDALNDCGLEFTEGDLVNQRGGVGIEDGRIQYPDLNNIVRPFRDEKVEVLGYFTLCKPLQHREKGLMRHAPLMCPDD